MGDELEQKTNNIFLVKFRIHYVVVMFYRMTMNMGAVAALRRVKNAISVARYVLEHTQHSLLVGDLATQFALSMGFKEETLETNISHNMWQKWKENDCQPNFWVVCKIIWICMNFYNGYQHNEIQFCLTKDISWE